MLAVYLVVIATIMFCGCANYNNNNENGNGDGNEETYIYFTDICNGPNSSLTRINDLVGTGSISLSGFGSPTDVEVGNDGKIYVADYGNNRIVRIDDITGAGWISYNEPNTYYSVGKLGIGPDGRIYYAVTWGTGGKIIAVNSIYGGGRVELTVPSPYSRAHDIAVGPNGKLYITVNSFCAGDGIIRIDDMSGNGLVFLGGFDEPYGITITENGYIYVADYGNDRIVRINNISGEGWISNTRFDGPSDVAVGNDGKIYVIQGHTIIRMDDMNGSGWIEYETGGTCIGTCFGIAVTE